MSSSLSHCVIKLHEEHHDLEDYQGHLVFNVDVGSHDVKVDAANGNVLAAPVDE